MDEHEFGRNRWEGREVTEAEPPTKDRNSPKCGNPCPDPYFLFHLPPGESQKMVRPQGAQILKLRIIHGVWENIDLLLLLWSTISVAALVIQMQGPIIQSMIGLLALKLVEYGSHGKLLINNLI